MTLLDRVRIARGLAALAPIALVVVGVNLIVDPANLFRADRAAQFARSLAAGEDLVLENLDQRRVKQLHARVSSEPIDVLVLGSSRSMQIRGEWFGDDSFFNASVPNALLQDCVALYQEYLEARGRPQRVILGAEPWFFNAAVENEIFQPTLADAYQRARARLGRPPVMLRAPHVECAWMALASPVYFQESLRAVARRGRRWREIWVAPVRDDPTRPRMLADGGIAYPSFEPRCDEIRRNVRAYLAQRAPYNMGGYRALDADLRALFDAFLADLTDGGASVLVVLPPCHPLFHAEAVATGRFDRIPEAEQFIRAAAGRRRVPVLGSFNPAVIGVTEADFHDATHPRGVVFQRLLAGTIAQSGINLSRRDSDETIK